MRRILCYCAVFSISVDAFGKCPTKYSGLKNGPIASCKHSETNGLDGYTGRIQDPLYLVRLFPSRSLFLFDTLRRCRAIKCSCCAPAPLVIITNLQRQRRQRKRWGFSYGQFPPHHLRFISGEPEQISCAARSLDLRR
jgi:hypothetical protein